MTTYKAIIHPVWLYGIQLWGSAKPTNTRILQAFQSIFLRIITSTPWYATNKNLHKDLKLPILYDLAKSHSTKFFFKLPTHSNPLIRKIFSHTNVSRRLKRLWPRDILNGWDKKKKIIPKLIKLTKHKCPVRWHCWQPSYSNILWTHVIKFTNYTVQIDRKYISLNPEKKIIYLVYHFIIYIWNIKYFNQNRSCVYIFVTTWIKIYWYYNFKRSIILTCATQKVFIFFVIVSTNRVFSQY